MSIVRVGLGETAKFAEGYEAIFGKNKKNETRAEPKPVKKPAAKAKKKAKKK